MVMAVVLRVKIAPNVTFTPQAYLGRYSEADLGVVVQELQDKGLAGTYKLIVMMLDFAFITAFGFWVILSHVLKSAGIWRWVGCAFALCFMALDFSEDVMLLTRLGVLGAFEPVALSDAISMVHYVTLAKYATFALCISSVFLLSRKGS